MHSLATFPRGCAVGFCLPIRHVQRMEAPETHVPEQIGSPSGEQMVVVSCDIAEDCAISGAELHAIERLLGDDLIQLLNA